MNESNVQVSPFEWNYWNKSTFHYIVILWPAPVLKWAIVLCVYVCVREHNKWVSTFSLNCSRISNFIVALNIEFTACHCLTIFYCGVFLVQVVFSCVRVGGFSASSVWLILYWFVGEPGKEGEDEEMEEEKVKGEWSGESGGEILVWWGEGEMWLLGVGEVERAIIIRGKSLSADPGSAPYTRGTW